MIQVLNVIKKHIFMPWGGGLSPHRQYDTEFNIS